MPVNVLEFLENSTAQYADKLAVKEGDASLTYSELTAESKRIGSALTELVTPGKPVGVYMEKGIEALCSFFGIVYAGAFYSMLNTELPDTRLGQIQSVLQAGLIITTDALRDKAAQLFPDCDICTVCELRKSDIDEAALKDVI